MRLLAKLRGRLPKLDDWVNGKPDAWDYEAVLQENGVEVVWDDSFNGWGFIWKHGGIYIGQVSKINARKAAAMFVSLWLRGVSASFANKLMDGYIIFLERQESTSITFLADIDTINKCRFLRLTQGKLRTIYSLAGIEKKLIETLDPQEDEEVIITFRKRKKQ